MENTLNKSKLRMLKTGERILMGDVIVLFNNSWEYRYKVYDVPEKGEVLYAKCTEYREVYGLLPIIKTVGEFDTAICIYPEIQSHNIITVYREEFLG